MICEASGNLWHGWKKQWNLYGFCDDWFWRVKLSEDRLNSRVFWRLMTFDLTTWSQVKWPSCERCVDASKMRAYGSLSLKNWSLLLHLYACGTMDFGHPSCWRNLWNIWVITKLGHLVWWLNYRMTYAKKPLPGPCTLTKIRGTVTYLRLKRWSWRAKDFQHISTWLTILPPQEPQVKTN